MIFICRVAAMRECVDFIGASKHILLIPNRLRALRNVRMLFSQNSNRTGHCRSKCKPRKVPCSKSHLFLCLHNIINTQQSSLGGATQLNQPTAPSHSSSLRRAYRAGPSDTLRSLYIFTPCFGTCFCRQGLSGDNVPTLRPRSRSSPAKRPFL